MITGIENRTPIGPELREERLPAYWSEYRDYEQNAADLHAEVERLLLEEIAAASAMLRPFMDSKQVISRVLTALGPRHTFHRQFSERFPNYRREQLLGMHLYALVARNESLWIYNQTHHAGHMFPNATYFISR
jgi:hypothetical protein